MAKIQSKYKDKFTPFFTTVIGGNPTKVTIKDMENNPKKWINSPVSHFYENHVELKKQINARMPKKEFEVLDMRLANTKGKLFDPTQSGSFTKKGILENLKKEQKKKRDRLVSLAAKNQTAKRKKATTKKVAEQKAKEVAAKK